jgi:hypothetical protein
MADPVVDPDPSVWTLPDTAGLDLSEAIGTLGPVALGEAL